MLKNKKETNKIEEENFKAIIDEKPYTLETAIYYCNIMSKKYQKLFCVIKVKKNKRNKKNYEIIGYNYYLQNSNNFILIYLTKYIKI